MAGDVISLRDDDLWLLAIAIGAVAVVVIALLLGLIIAVLQRIDRHAARTYTASKQIAQNTVALWALDQMNRDLVAIRDAARAAEGAGAGSPVAAPLAAVTDRVKDWIGGRDDEEDKSS